VEEWLDGVADDENVQARISALGEILVQKPGEEFSF